MNTSGLLQSKWSPKLCKRSEVFMIPWTFRIKGFVGVLNWKAEQPVWTRTANGANKKLVLHMRLRCGSISITTPASHLADEFDVQSANCTGKLAWKLSIKFCVLHEAMNGCKKKSKDSLKASFENVNIWFVITPSKLHTTYHVIRENCCAKSSDAGLRIGPSWKICWFS